VLPITGFKARCELRRIVAAVASVVAQRVGVTVAVTDDVLDVPLGYVQLGGSAKVLRHARRGVEDQFRGHE
jgi:hypothetical protein